MHFSGFGEAKFWTRALVAVITFVVLAGAAAVAVVFAMMIVLFSADSGGLVEPAPTTFNRLVAIIAVALGVAVITPPVLLLFRVPPVYTAIPAGFGFVVAGLTTLWFVVSNLGGR